MAPPPPGAARSPTSAEVSDRLAALQRKDGTHIRVVTVGNSGQGRPIEAAMVTDRSVDDADKQNVLIVAGQHGNEESARLVALRLIDMLLSPGGRPILRRQKIAVVPNVNPDGAELNIYGTPAGIKPNLDHADSGPTIAEARAVEKIANELQPELFVDVHARGHAGCSHDMVLFPPSKPYTEDEHLLHQIARTMAEAGERSGIPHVVHPLTWPGWGGPDLDGPSTTLFMYRRFKAMVFLTENAEHDEFSYPARRRAMSGVNRLKAVLLVGNRRHPSLRNAGYPVSCAIGMFHAGAVAVGATAEARRASRIELWRNASHFARLGATIPERTDRKVLEVEYDGPPLRAGVGFQIRNAGKLHVVEVRHNGRRLKAGEVNGYHAWQDRATTYAVAALPTLEPGKHEIAYSFR